jgi:ABC superfamily ATP binding cassette transporter, ABC/membrane protein
MRGKTVIMIAHRLSSIRDVDEILVIENGKVAERGSHYELISKESKYKKLQELYSKANEWRLS